MKDSALPKDITKTAAAAHAKAVHVKTAHSRAGLKAAGDAPGARDVEATDDKSGGTKAPPAGTVIDSAADTPQAAETPPPAGPMQSTPPAPLTPPPAGTRRSGAGGLILGGVIAALIGAGALYGAQSLGWVDLSGEDEALLARIDTLETELAATSEALGLSQTEIKTLSEAEPDLSGVTTAIDAVRGTAEATGADLAKLTTRLDGIETKLNELAVTQIPEAELPKAISDAYDAKLADLLASIDTRFEGMQTALDTKMAELEASQTAAAQAEADAQRAAQLAEARAAMGEVRAALDSGAAYAEPLAEVADLSGAQVPEPLAAHAEDGIPTLETLKVAFPDAARQALARATSAAAESGEISGWEAFLRNQAGVRSLEAREGNDPDAVLSRAEAALGRGDLDGALTELDSLPAIGQEAMADWTALAETRRDALNVAADLAAQLEQN